MLAGSASTGSELGIAVRLLPLFNSRKLLLLSSLSSSSSHGTALSAGLEYCVLMSWTLFPASIWDLGNDLIPLHLFIQKEAIVSLSRNRHCMILDWPGHN